MSGRWHGLWLSRAQGVGAAVLEADAGAESDGELAHRGAVAVAELLGTRPVTFPGNHGGFLGGEYGQVGDPDGFASTLREVLGAEA